MKMSKNSREHYHGIPNKDEVLDFIGETCFKILMILFIVFIIVMLN